MREARENFPIQVPFAGSYRELFNSDDMAYGGSGVVNTGELLTSTYGDRHTLSLRIPPMGCAVLQSVSPPVVRKAAATRKKAVSATAEARASLDSQ